MNRTSASLPTLNTDLLLLHAPAFFDFRQRRDIYFPFLGTSGDVPITPLYEYFPVGFKTLKRYLSERGFDVKLMNLSTILLRFPMLEFEAIAKSIDASLIGIDLHWMVHVQGSLAVAERLKKIRPDIPLIFGGISSTYYADQLIRYPFIDMVMRGYDTHGPMATLLKTMKQGDDLRVVPNLLWKSGDGQVHDNGLSHLPDTYGCGIDWSDRPQEVTTQTFPILELLSTQNAGCAYSCPWCGGSCDAFQRIYGGSKSTVIRKPASEIRYEFEMANKLPGVDQHHFYAVGSYNESKRGLEFFLDLIGESQFKSVSYEQHHLTPNNILRRMAEANKRTTITISPQSHDPQVAKLAGSGNYSNQELECWLDEALECGIYQVDIWYFIGMPEQDERSVMETVDYCQRLLERFKGGRVNPILCPMIPFLDPASAFFEYPDEYGYRVFYRTVEEHRRGMERASIINRINYETEWLSRSDLINVGFKAVRRLMEAKAESNFLPSAWIKDYIAKIDDALDFIGVVHEADCLSDDDERARALAELGDDILHRNNMIFFSGVMCQAFPINRQIGGRWFDELGWKDHHLGTAHKNHAADVISAHNNRGLSDLAPAA